MYPHLVLPVNRLVDFEHSIPQRIAKLADQHTTRLSMTGRGVDRVSVNHVYLVTRHYFDSSHLPPKCPGFVNALIPCQGCDSESR